MLLLVAPSLLTQVGPTLTPLTAWCASVRAANAAAGDAGCTDLQPPRDWLEPTCEAQLHETDNCALRRVGNLTDGVCHLTCGVCAACAAMVYPSTPALRKEEVAQTVVLASTAQKEDILGGYKEAVQGADTPRISLLSPQAEATPSLPLRRLNSQDKGLEGVRLLHIPKTGMTSLCVELYGESNTQKYGLAHPEAGCYGGWYYEGVGLHCAESCYKYARLQPGAPLSPQPALLSTLFREPRAHVLSMYVECAFDTVWPVPLRDAETGVPGATVPKFDEASFVAWIRHFEKWTETKGGDYQCYNPWNLQTRAMTCDAIPAPHHIDSHVLDEARDRGGELAVAALLSPPVPPLNRDMVEHVGVIEMYDESWCLLKWQMDGTLPQECDCENMGRRREDTKAGGAASLRERPDWMENLSPKAAASASVTRLWHENEVHEAHNLPAHPPAWDLGDEAKRIIDAITAKDRELYGNAVVRLLGDLCEVQRQESGRHLVCPEQLQNMKGRTQHIEGLAARIDAVAKPCLA